MVWWIFVDGRGFILGFGIWVFYVMRDEKKVLMILRLIIKLEFVLLVFVVFGY